ncbi:hypothetical protein BC567DRAFT_17689 [Phyllosticta citribraziliensis]
MCVSIGLSVCLSTYTAALRPHCTTLHTSKQCMRWLILHPSGFLDLLACPARLSLLSSCLTCCQHIHPPHTHAHTYTYLCPYYLTIHAHTYLTWHITPQQLSETCHVSKQASKQRPPHRRPAYRSVA